MTVLCCRYLWAQQASMASLPSLWSGDGNGGQGFLRIPLTTWVSRQHDLHFDAQHTLSEQHMAPAGVCVGVNRVSTVDHQTIHNFMDLTLCPQFPRHYNLAALAPLSMMTHSTLQQALLEVCAADSAGAMAHGALLSAFPP